ncbi:apolipoprotein D-like [Lineus longissimus]|uniref:apolipoprotein D-like n=1 Tax=Lineus longissimus TaxID=88925 RepID=UPI002B4E8CE5
MSSVVYAVVIFVLSVLFLGAQSQIPMLGPCPGDKLPTQANFDMQKYMGIWYEYYRNFILFELGDKCSRANYTLQPDGKIKVVNTGEKAIFGTKNVAFGEAYAPDPADASKLIAKVGGGPESPYWVLATDYENYSVVYLCVDKRIPGLPMFPWRKEILWVLSRSREDFSAELLAEINEKIDRLNITRKFLMRTDQTNCSDGPETESTKMKFIPAQSAKRPPTISFNEI